MRVQLKVVGTLWLALSHVLYSSAQAVPQPSEPVGSGANSPLGKYGTQTEGSCPCTLNNGVCQLVPAATPPSAPDLPSNSTESESPPEWRSTSCSQFMQNIVSGCQIMFWPVQAMHDKGQHPHSVLPTRLQSGLQACSCVKRHHAKNPEFSAACAKLMQNACRLLCSHTFPCRWFSLQYHAPLLPTLQLDQFWC